MKIIDVRITGLAGGTVEGGWAEDLKPEDDINTILEVLTDEGLAGIGSAMTSKALVEASMKLLRPMLIGEGADEAARGSDKMRQRTFLEGSGSGRISSSWSTPAAANNSGRTATSGLWRRRRCWRLMRSSGSRRRCPRTIWRASSSCAGTRRYRSAPAKC